jgi:hypothetical protein
MHTTITPVKKGIDFITASKKPYPDWIKQHRIFRDLPSIEKVWPRIGLSNFREPCEIMNSEEAVKSAKALGVRIVSEITTVSNALYGLLDKLASSTEVDKDTACAKLQETINLYGSVSRSLGAQYTNTDGSPQFISVKDGKTTLVLRADIFGAKENKPVFKKGEVIFRVLNKLKEMQPTNFINIDQLQEFKDYSRTNVGKNTYNIVFSSTGEDGLWDIATASMRGITSCQSWTSPQSKGLIGTMSSKYTAVIYMEHDSQMPPYGTKMLYRAMVRFCINGKTKKPVIVIDKMYMSVNEATLSAFKRILHKKSGIDVAYAQTTAADVSQTWYIPSEPELAGFYAQNEVSYMDTKINVTEHKIKVITAPVAKNANAITIAFKNSVAADLNKLIASKRAQYDKAFKELEAKRSEFYNTKAEWENKDLSSRGEFTLKRPMMDGELADFFRNGVDNMFDHCDKKYGTNSAGKVFADVILTAVPKTGLDHCATKEEYHRAYLMNFLRDFNKIKSAAKAEMLKGSWAKSFPKSADRFFGFVFSQMKPYLMGSMKELLKGKN